MNHLKIYNSIIQTARSQNRTRESDVYYENHHIVPKCLGGTNDKENLVLLTAREHFVCHKLLTYVYKDNRKIIYAFHRMCFSRKDKIRLSSKDYAYIRELIASIPGFNKGKTFKEIFINKHGEHEGLKIYNDFKERNSERNKGNNNPMFGKKHLIESIRKNSKSQPFTSQNFPQWLKDKISEKSKGENNAMFGKSFYDIWLIKYGKHIADQKLEEYKINKKSKIWVKNTDLHKSKQIKKEELEEYLNNGWEIGRFKQPNRKSFSQETINKQSIKRKEYWQRKKRLL